jgi:hypothetical protein
MLLQKGMIIAGLGFKIEITSLEPVSGKVVGVPTRNLFNNLFMGDELIFSSKDEKRNMWLQPETYTVGNMTDYVGGWFIGECDGRIYFGHTVP